LVARAEQKGEGVFSKFSLWDVSLKHFTWLQLIGTTSLLLWAARQQELRLIIP